MSYDWLHDASAKRGNGGEREREQEDRTGLFSFCFFPVQICGREALERTTLKSLGLNSGKAIIRLIYRDPEQLRTQAHVSSPLLPKPTSAVDSWSDSCSSNSQSSSWDSSRIKRGSQRVPSPAPHCSKTTDGATSSTTIVPSVKDRSESEDEMNVSIDEARVDAKADERKSDVNAEERMDVEDERMDARSEGRCQETMDTSAVEGTYSVASGVKDRIAERERTVAEACKKRRDQEDTYKIEFVRCNCAYVRGRACLLINVHNLVNCS